MPLTCIHCQIQLPDDAAFCYKCGKSVTAPTKEQKRAEEEKRKNDLWRELGDYRGQVEDFGTYESKLYNRATKWAEYYALTQLHSKDDWCSHLFNLSMDVNSISWKFHYFTIENNEFPTNKPNAHEAIFRGAFFAWFLNEGMHRGYIQCDDSGDYVFTPEARTSLKQLYTKWDEEQLYFHQPDYEKIRSLAKKDAELFPDPEPIRVEVNEIGAVLNFTTWDSALIVYMDGSHKGEEVQFTCQDEAIMKVLQKQKQDKIQVLERQSGSVGRCAAIFMRIPLVTDEHRNKEKVLKHIDGSIKSQTHEAAVTLFRGKVAELDWRGR